MRVHSHSSFSASPLHLSPPPSTPPPRHHGEGQHGGAGAREEGDGSGERQEDELGVVIKVRAATGLDPGRLDPIFAPARGFGGAG